ncbi:unnamed protein product [Agarophyton chilense]
MHPYIRIRHTIRILLSQLSQTHQLSHAIQKAADTLQDDRTLYEAVELYRAVVEGSTAQSSEVVPPRPEDLFPYENERLHDRLNFCRVTLIGCAQQRLLVFQGCVNGAPFQPLRCTHGCDLDQDAAPLLCKALDILAMCEADLSAFCAVFLDYPDGVIPVFSEKIKPCHGKNLVVCDDNVCFDAHPGQGMHFVDINRYASRTVVQIDNFNRAVGNNTALQIIGLAYLKLLSDFQSLFGLEGPLGGSFLCSYFKARQGTWGTLFTIVRDFCLKAENGCVSVRDNDENFLNISISEGHASIDHEHIKCSTSGRFAAAVVHSWTATDRDVHISCLFDRQNIAVALSKLNWCLRDDDFDSMMFITSAVAVLEQKQEAQMALRDLRLYESIVRKMASMEDEDHPELLTDELIEDAVGMPKKHINEWWELSNLLDNERKASDNDRVDFFNLSDWAREIPLVSSSGVEVHGMRILPKEGWFPGERLQKRSQCSFLKSFGSLSVSNQRVRMTHVPKLLAGTVHFAKRITGLGVSGVVQVDLGEYRADEGRATAGVLDLALSGQLGDSSALWALEAIYMGKVSVSLNSPSSIKNCARKFDDDGYFIEAVMPARIFNQVAVVHDDKNVYAVLGTGFRCVKVLKMNEMRYVLERATLDDTKSLKRGILCGGRTVG